MPGIFEDSAPRLSPAYAGYVHQDIVTAYALASLLLPRTSDSRVASEQRTAGGNCFDDLSVSGTTYRRIQLKSHSTEGRQLSRSDFTRNTRNNIRIDKAIRSFVDDSNPADEYRLVFTYGSPDSSLTPYVRADPTSEPLFPGFSTDRWTLDIDELWPEQAAPEWPHLEAFTREVVQSFCQRFVIETSCPRSSYNLREPGHLDQLLIGLLRDGVGVGYPPNDRREVVDAAAFLIQLAQRARISGGRLFADDVISGLGLQVDYGRVAELLPIDESCLMRREEAVSSLINALGCTQRFVITGPPGSGKSWLLHLLRKELLENGWAVALHFCFVDLLEDMRERRASIDTTFGSLIAELLDADQSILSDRVPRYAVGPRELEQMLADAYEDRPDRTIAIIVDGLDHVDRVLSRSHATTAADIVQELAALTLPANVKLIVGSQPGTHLSALTCTATQYLIAGWAENEIRELSDRVGVRDALSAAGWETEAEPTLEVIVDKARGNPLYATYLARTAVQVAAGELEPGEEADIVAYIAGSPVLDADLNDYYQWLLRDFETDSGSIFIVQMLSLLDFPVSRDELAEIRPEFRHLIPLVLRRLAPVLMDEPVLGGIRVYHESFQRYIRESLSADPNADPAAILAPAIEWLERKGFFDDERAFRSLITMLRVAGRDADAVALICVDFVSNAISRGQPEDAVMVNLSEAADAAAQRRSWPDLARLIELSRCARYLYRGRLNDEEITEAYGRAFAALRGPEILADRLLHDNRCTFIPRPGLVLCRLCEERGAPPPWRDYITAYRRFKRIDNTVYGGGEHAIEVANITGELRLAGRDQAVSLVINWLREPDGLPLHPFNIAFVLGELFDADSVQAVIDELPPGLGRASANLACARFQSEVEERRNNANAALEEGLGLPPAAKRLALSLGADVGRLVHVSGDLDALTVQVCRSDVRVNEGIVGQWLMQLDIATALGDHGSLFRAENLIPLDTWFHQWLRFSVMLRRNVDNETLINELNNLSENVEVFVGEPRVCDLYPFHDEIRKSFRQVLVALNDEEWSRAVGALSLISRQTSTWLLGSRSGPLPLDEFLEICIATANTPMKRCKASEVGSELLAPDKCTSEFYDTHALDQLLLVKVHVAAGETLLAEQAWTNACKFLAGYGWRKDITVYELLDPLDTLGSTDPLSVRRCLKEMQAIVKRVLIHTDGRETRHAIHQWIDTAARFHPAGALDYVARVALDDYPAFGEPDHAIPEALVSLEGHARDDILLPAWIAIEQESNLSAASALQCCERAIGHGMEFGLVAWLVLVATLVGDCTIPPHGTQELVCPSATRLGLNVPDIVEMEESTSEQRPYVSPWQRVRLAPTPSFDIPIAASPLQIAHAVRDWWHDHEGVQVDAVINAIGWRLIGFVQEDRRHDAEILIRRIARDKPVYETDNLLGGISEGLARHGEVSLAAITGALAYTRANDGWRRFAGKKGEDIFLRSLSWDVDNAWSTLANEVADNVASGGEVGVNAHLIELLAGGDYVEDALRAWAEAAAVVLHRLPATGPEDEIHILYDDTIDDAAISIMRMVAGRINHCLKSKRRVAVAAAALLAAHAGAQFGETIRIAEKHAPPSVLLALLQVADQYEPEPYEASQLAEHSIARIAAGNLVSARVLARGLLARAGLPSVDAPPRALISVPAINDEQAAFVLRGIGQSRYEPVEAIWPEFGRRAAENLQSALDSERLRTLTRRLQSYFRRDRKGRAISLWSPACEEIERVLQTTGAGARVALALAGIIDPSLDESIGGCLLGDIDLGVRLALSRTIRPDHHMSPTSTPDLLQELSPRTVGNGKYLGWAVVAHHERELVVGDQYDKPVTARREVWSSLVMETDGIEHAGLLPVGIGIPEIWSRPLPRQVLSRLFSGPLGCYQVTRDPFGLIELLVPHPAIVFACNLVPARFERGLTLLDVEGEEAVVCRTWRQSLLGDDLEDYEHQFDGMELLARPDVIDSISSLGINEIVYVITARTETTSGE